MNICTAFPRYGTVPISVVYISRFFFGIVESNSGIVDITKICSFVLKIYSHSPRCHSNAVSYPVSTS
jgi:hypothetical protein